MPPRPPLPRYTLNIVQAMCRCAPGALCWPARVPAAAESSQRCAARSLWRGSRFDRMLTLAMLRATIATTGHRVQLLSKLPPGQSTVVSSRAAGKRRNAHEMVYVVRDPEDPSGSMKLHSMVVLANARAFTVTFGVDEDAYPLLESLGRFLLNAFVAIPQPVPVAADTPANPRDVDWDTDTCPELGVAVARPRSWVRVLDAQRRLLRLSCLRGERLYKALRVLTVDLSAVRSSDLLQDLASQFAVQAESEVRRPVPTWFARCLAACQGALARQSLTSVEH